MNQSEFRLFYGAFVDSQEDTQLRALLRQCLFNVAVHNITAERCFVVVAHSDEAANQLKQDIGQIKGMMKLNLANLNYFVVCTKGESLENPIPVGVWEIFKSNEAKTYLNQIV